jgi:hypothetical protein
MFPRQTGKVSVTWQAGEGTSVTAADQALGQLSMTPKTCIAITDVSPSSCWRRPVLLQKPS